MMAIMSMVMVVMLTVPLGTTTTVLQLLPILTLPLPVVLRTVPLDTIIARLTTVARLVL